MENHEYPLISIGVSAYNRKEYLKLCLNSLMAQTYPNYEIIVIDDGSSDGTDLMMAEFYPAIKYVRQANSGDAAAKNHAARIAKGDYIVFNDSDDMFYPDSVMRLYQALPADGNACSYGTYQTIDIDGNPLPTKRKISCYPSGEIIVHLLKHILVNNCGTLIPRQKFLDLGGFDSSLRVMYDYKFFLELSLQCNFFAIQEPVFLRRRHNANLSKADYGKMQTARKVFEDFLLSHPELMSSYAKIISQRKSDLENKLYREAKREGLKKEAAQHAKNAFVLNPEIKTFFRMMISLL